MGSFGLPPYREFRQNPFTRRGGIADVIVFRHPIHAAGPTPDLYEDVVASVWHALVWRVRALGFWLAVVLPFIHLPVLANGFAGPEEGLAFVGLLFLNVVALVVGHEHRQ